LEGASTSIFMDNPIIFAGIGATALLVLGGFFLFKRKNKANNSLPDSFTL
jgi:LPXTG-motif cell wall-anchored protein